MLPFVKFLCGAMVLACGTACAAEEPHQALAAGRVEAEALLQTLMGTPPEACSSSSEEGGVCSGQTENDVQSHVETSSPSRLLVCVSESIPTASLKQLAKDVGRAGGHLVLRGLIEESFQKTQLWAQAFIQEGVSVLIDPTVFEAYDIKEVPTFVVTDTSETTSAYDTLRGNVTLLFALETITQKGDTKHADIFLTRLKGAS